MAINLEAIKNKLKQLQQGKQGNQGNELWKPEVGQQIVRIIPSQYNKENPFSELYLYYELSNKVILSPITFGKPDPIVEFADKLKRTGIKEDYLIAKKLLPKFRCYVPVLVRGKEYEGVRLWSFGKEVYTEILSIISDPDYGDITDSMIGRDISIEYKLPIVGSGKTFPETIIRAKPAQTPITQDPNIIEKLKEPQPNIFNIFKEYSYDELTAILQNWLNPENAESGNTTALDQKSNQNTKETIQIPQTTIPDIDKAFDDLFNS